MLNQWVSSQAVVLCTAVTLWIEPWLAVPGRIAGLKLLIVLQLAWVILVVLVPKEPSLPCRISSLHLQSQNWTWQRSWGRGCRWHCSCLVCQLSCSLSPLSCPFVTNPWHVSPHTPKCTSSTAALSIPKNSSPTEHSWSSEVQDSRGLHQIPSQASLLLHPYRVWQLLGT